MNSTTALDDEARYRALCAHDARFDGRFFTAVTSTGIYCRPICRVRTPRRENCRFFEHATQAEQAGFRPCLRCRPELAPLDRHWSTEDASVILVQQASRWLDAPPSWLDPATEGAAMGLLAARLGVSDRHLRRVFGSQLGVSPLQYLLTRKLLAAKQLLADTAMPVSQIALASGFASLRRFNAAFLERYGLNPTQMRRGQTAKTAGGNAGCSGEVRLSWRPPFDASAMLSFLAIRQLPGVEHVNPEAFSLQRTLQLTVAQRTHTGWLSVRLVPDARQLVLRVSDGLLPVLPSVIWRVREVFDLDADPATINATLHADFPDGDGLRVPGCFDGFELAVRAVLGQQITVAAARTLATRLLDRFGTPVETPNSELNRLFPSPHTLASADPARLGEIGIVRQRQAALQALARAVADGSLELDGRAPMDQTVQTLQALPGIGPWTAQYIAMRALRWPDAWPVGDVALIKTLGILGRGRTATLEADRQSAAWRPWRSYAVIRAWAGTHATNPILSSGTPTP
ncbi:AlkA N-terminal domain-containing protein [Hydrogenophaga sp. A37]|uniref:DNA-3-methyladenine glycosylase 2 family protein n=1 Tax=Hydrogenophaga sp. A37 TaxID=1945864 RepID=UPI0009D5F83A|nr:DNA-3-methyladenine glycosylase 2 family protein [Hydrogenophaga sp. A37]OOG79229.1 adenosine deaminase [Hydrogenophaga sp. A37]